MVEPKKISCCPRGIFFFFFSWKQNADFFYRLSAKIRCILTLVSFLHLWFFSFSLVIISDIDECVIETHTCIPVQFCENTEGGFRCHDDYDAVMTSESDYEFRDDEYQRHSHAAVTSSTSQPSDVGYLPTDSGHLVTTTCSPGYRYDPTTQSCNGNAQTPLLRFVVDLLYNKCCNKSK